MDTSANHNLDLDPDGYLADPGTWNEKVACILAGLEGVSDDCPLSSERMEILKYVRDYYHKFEAFPIIRAVCKNLGQDKSCQYEQFPDPVTAWKIAGLPKPTPEVLAKIRH
ncbi:MAG: TusE/DsrC/DsvC family sulfur relay protein [Desulfobacter sp.]|nr:MAG: TusE/DsrC/DsvC family sulfur relay protein [Desulfobacter sp.]